MIRPSSALINSLLASRFKSKEEIASSTLSFGDGDGVVIGGGDTINDTSVDLSVFKKHSFITLVTRPKTEPNRNKTVKVLDSSVTKLEVAAGSLTAMAAGTQHIITEPDIHGSFASIFTNCIFRLFTESVPQDGDSAEPGSPVCEITLNGADFVAGQPENGLNFGDLVDAVLRRAIDPATGNQEIMSGTPTQAGTIRSFACYANDVITGASIASHRFYGSVTGPGGQGDMEISPGSQVTTEAPVQITSVNVKIEAAAYL